MTHRNAELLLQVKGPRLEIKKDIKGMVHVPGAVVVEVTSARQLISTIEKGQLRRHVGETQMNRESSRSHLIMSIIIESTNLQTQAVTRGKLSFVDLAGSERWAPSAGGGVPMLPAASTSLKAQIALDPCGNTLYSSWRKGCESFLE